MENARHLYIIGRKHTGFLGSFEGSKDTQPEFTHLSV